MAMHCKCRLCECCLRFDLADCDVVVHRTDALMSCHAIACKTIVLNSNVLSHVCGVLKSQTDR